MSHPIHVNTPQDGALLGRMMRDYRSGRVVNQTEPAKGQRRHETPGNIAFVLLEDLESGGQAEAFVLRKPDRIVQMVTLKGSVSGGSFQLHYGSPVTADGPEASGVINYNATANEMRAALEECESIGIGGVRVTFGRVMYRNSAGTGVEVIPGRWFIEFLKLASPELLQPFETEDNALTSSPNQITAETYILTPTTDPVTVLSTTPVGHPTPQHVGAIGTAKWIHGIGYSVSTIECRDFQLNEGGSS